MEGNGGHRIGVSTLRGRLGRGAEAERQVGHRVDDDALILRRVVGDAAEARLAHVVAVQELLLGARLRPDLVLGIGREEVESGHVQPELGLRLAGEAAEAGAEGDQVLARKVSRLLHDLLLAVVDAVAMQPEAVHAVRAVDEQAHVVANVFGELLEEAFCLLVRKWSHLAISLSMYIFSF